jgi:signal peptidase I
MKKRVWQWFKSVGSTVAFVWVFTHGVAQATVVPSESMMPTILVGDHFFIDKVGFPGNYPAAAQKYLPVREIERGDIVALWSPETPDLRLIKRVIGLPGDTIEMRHRAVFIDGRKLDEPYSIHTDNLDLQRRDNFAPFTIPADHFFLMGDNRDNSNDSRFWGLAPRENLIGKTLFVYWSFEDPPAIEAMSFSEWVEHSATVAAHFFTRTRWLRTGTILR